MALKNTKTFCTTGQSVSQSVNDLLVSQSVGRSLSQSIIALAIGSAWVFIQAKYFWHVFEKEDKEMNNLLTGEKQSTT